MNVARVRGLWRALPGLLCALLLAGSASAQSLDLLSRGNSGGTSSAEPEVTARLVRSGGASGDEVTFSLTVQLPPGHYTVPMDPGPETIGKPTRILVKKTAGLEPIGEGFQANRPPKIVDEPGLGKQEKYLGEVTWSRKYRLKSGVDSENVSLEGVLDYQVCDRVCRLMETPFAAVLSESSGGGQASVPDPAKVHPFEYEKHPELRNGEPSPARVRAELSPKDAQSGEEVTLEITMELDEGWHTYSTTLESGPGAMPTDIRLTKSSGLVPVDEKFAPGEPPKVERKDLGGGPRDLEVHYDRVTWTRTFQVQSSAEPGRYGIEGRIRYLTCTDARCLTPVTVSFALGDLNNAGEVPAALSASESDGSGDPAALGGVSMAVLAQYLLFAFLGGLILNVMPCVLPVVAIKAMGFVQQAGESRGRIFALNLSYAVGVVAVFMLLATLATFPHLVGFEEKLTWGGLFQVTGFTLMMSAVVFAMGLSLLGVFEIPVPGFVGSAAGQQDQEGLTGAFLTGILATVLATPCSGPFLGVTLFWSVSQTPPVTYLVWGTMGLGLAFPYLVFGVFPKAIQWLPRPGQWMVRVKQLSGFVLIAVAIWLLNLLEKDLLISWLVVLLGLSLGLWMIGSLSTINSSAVRKWTVRLAAVLVVWLGWGSGAILTGTESTLKPYPLAFWHETRKVVLGTELPWKPFSAERVESAVANRQTVLIDFTADWCLTCKMVERAALNTEETLELVQRHNVVPLKADYTHRPPEVKRWLEKFNSISVPLTVIFPANRPEEPIVLRDVYSQSTLLKNLRRAVAAEENLQARRGAESVDEPRGASVGR